MAHIIQGNQSYKISSDDIDLDYFYRNIHLPKNGLIKPLWTNIGNKGNDYYEFEVISEEKANVDSKIYYDHNLICESYMCHICDINVPKMYRKEHNQTTKHKVCLEIADKSLERFRKHVNEEFDYQKSIIRYDCYFCPSCCAAVATQLKGDHEKTPNHLKSVKHDNLLKEFLKYYLDKDSVIIDCELNKMEVSEKLNQVHITDSNNNAKKKSRSRKKNGETLNIALNSSATTIERKYDRVENGTDNVPKEDTNSNIVKHEPNKSVKSKKHIETTVNTKPRLKDAEALSKGVTVNSEVNNIANNKPNEAANLNSDSRNTETQLIELPMMVNDTPNGTKLNSDNSTRLCDRVENGNDNVAKEDTNSKIVKHESNKSDKLKKHIVSIANTKPHSNDAEALAKSVTVNSEVNKIANNKQKETANLNSDCRKPKTQPIELPMMVKEKPNGTKLNSDNSTPLCDRVKNGTDNVAKEDTNSNTVKNEPKKSVKSKKRIKATVNTKPHLNDAESLPKGVTVNSEVNKIANNKPNEVGNLDSDGRKTETQLIELPMMVKEKPSEKKLNSDNSTQLYDRGENSTDNVAKEDTNSNIVKHEPSKSVKCKKHIETTVNTKPHSSDAEALPKGDTVTTEVNEISNNKSNEVANLNSDVKTNETQLIELTMMVKEKPNKAKLNAVTVFERYYNNISLRHKVKMIDIDILEIKFSKGGVMRIPATFYHGYNEVDGDRRCELCHLSVDDIVSHVFTETHLIFSRGQNADENCIRKCYPYYNHCVLCNEIFNDLSSHIFNDKTHIANMNKAIVINKNIKTDLNTISTQMLSSKTYCGFCNIYIKSSEYESHEDTQTHRDHFKREFAKVRIEASVKIEPKKVPHEGTCRICNILVPLKNAEEHVKGDDHILKYNAMMFDNKLKRCVNGFRCDACEYSISIDNLLNHIENTAHTSRLNRTITPKLHEHLRPLEHTKSHVYCRVCEIPISNDLSSIYDHLALQTHQKYFGKLMVANKIKVDEWGIYSYCMLCHKSGKDKLMGHINSDKHMNLMAKIATETSADSVTRIHPYMETTDNPKELKCKVCLIKIPFSNKSIEKHVLGKNHIHNYNRILYKFKLIDNCVRVVSFPDTASVKTPNSPEVNSNNLTKFIVYNRFVDNKDNYFFELPTSSESMISNSSITIKDNKDPEIAGNEVMKIEESLFQKSKTPTLHEHMDQGDEPGHLYCKVCQVPVPDNATSVETHINDLDHMDKFFTLITDNKLDERATCYYCKICNILLSKNLAFVHIFSDIHKRKMDNHLTAETMNAPIARYLMKKIENGDLQCKLCKTEIPDKVLYLKLHSESTGHMEMFDEFLDTNGLDLYDNKRFCNYCQKYLALGTEYEHVESKRHKNNISPSVQYTCNVCKVEIPNNLHHINKHLRGTLHQSKIFVTPN